MARIQILQLPPCGSDGEQPFALIVDQCETPPQRIVTGLPTDDASDTLAFMPVRRADFTPLVEFTDPWQEFGKQIGARGVMVTPERVDIVDSADEDAPLVEFDHAALTDSIVTALRFHLESGEASDALRAWFERRAATGMAARGGR